ncbi:AAA family ATPase [Metallosphaera sedula]|uniref:AAA family ATPase n=1 Tax=Metallosphaera sedula TaxID=43687 RepID=UPI0020BDFA5F|nr:P-loop NTPase [Metallosphaera sedula]BBL47450.1 iron-sulfur cluster carrier protein [Metallosphaera sedula]
MRIPVLSVKGGIGKSTISVLLAKELALRGEKVIILDRDQLGFISSLAGIESKGMIASVVDGESCECHAHIKIGKGQVHIIKFYGDGPRLESDLNVIKNDEKLTRELTESYTLMLKSIEHSYMILDNPALSLPNEIGNMLETTSYLSLYPGTRSLRVMVSDITTHHFENTLKYIEALNLGSREIPLANVVGQFLVINMAPPGWNYRVELPNLVTEVKRGKFLGAYILPFSDDLFQFSGQIDDMPRIKQVEILANHVLKDITTKDVIE